MWTENGTSLTLPPWLFDTDSISITLTSTGTGLHWKPMPLPFDAIYSMLPSPKSNRKLEPGWECAKERERVKALNMRGRKAVRPSTTRRNTQGGPFGKRK